MRPPEFCRHLVAEAGAAAGPPQRRRAAQLGDSTQGQALLDKFYTAARIVMILPAMGRPAFRPRWMPGPTWRNGTVIPPPTVFSVHRANTGNPDPAHKLQTLLAGQTGRSKTTTSKSSIRKSEPLFWRLQTPQNARPRSPRSFGPRQINF